MNSDRIGKWRRRAQILGAAAGMAYSYPRAFNTFSLKSDMPAVTRGKGKQAAKSVGAKQYQKAFRKVAKKSGRKIAKGAMLARSKAPYVATHSTGYVGAFKKPIAKKRGRRVSKFDTSGVVLKREYSDIAIAQECSYVGHGIPLNQVIFCALRALLRSLFKKGGLDVSDWTDQAGFAGFWNIYYTLGANPANVVVIQTTIVVGQTYQAIADSMTGLLRASITNTEAIQSITFVNTRMFTENTGGSSPAFAEINLKNYNITTDYWSIIKIKNVSLAGGDSTNLDRDLSTNIESQPLLGRLYATDKWSNGFQAYKQLATGAGNATVQADGTTGRIQESSATLGFGSGNTNPFAKPPPAYMLGTKKSTKVRINPGELKVDVVKWKATMSWDTFMNKLIFNVNSDVDNQYRLFGAAHMFAFEREVEIGGSLASSIRIAYQVDFVLKMCGTSIAHKVAPIVDVTD